MYLKASGVLVIGVGVVGNLASVPVYLSAGYTKTSHALQRVELFITRPVLEPRALFKSAAFTINPVSATDRGRPLDLSIKDEGSLYR